MDTAETILTAEKLIAVLVVDDAAQAVPLANILLENGVRAMELTLRTEAAFPALEAIKREVPEMTAGVGTILTPAQVRQAKETGASFGVSPGLNRSVLAEAETSRLPFAPGVATPSEVEAALECGCRIMKFFPATPLGGIGYLRNMAAPYVHLGVRFIPLGGINEVNLAEWLAEPLVAAVGGSWIAPRDLIKSESWDEIGKRAAAAAAIASGS